MALAVTGVSLCVCVVCILKAVFSFCTKWVAFDTDKRVQLLGWAVEQLAALLWERSSNDGRIISQLPPCSHTLLCYILPTTTMSSFFDQTRLMRSRLGYIVGVLLSASLALSVRHQMPYDENTLHEHVFLPSISFYAQVHIVSLGGSYTWRALSFLTL